MRTFGYCQTTASDSANTLYYMVCNEHYDAGKLIFYALLNENCYQTKAEFCRITANTLYVVIVEGKVVGVASSIAVIYTLLKIIYNSIFSHRCY